MFYLYVPSEAVESKLVKPETSHKGILPPMVSVLWIISSSSSGWIAVWPDVRIKSSPIFTKFALFYIYVKLSKVAQFLQNLHYFTYKLYCPNSKVAPKVFSVLSHPCRTKWWDLVRSGTRLLRWRWRRAASSSGPSQRPRRWRREARRCRFWRLQGPILKTFFALPNDTTSYG